MLAIYTFNSLQLLLDQHPLTNFKNKKAQALLIFLAVQRGQQFERKYLQTLFWSDSTYKKASNSLRQTLSLMRRVLPDGLVRQERRMVWVDAEAEIYLDVNHLDDNPTLYTGRFMEGFDLKNAEGWEAWLIMQRERYEVEAIVALEAAARQAQQERQFDRVINHLQRVLAIDSWREQTHVQLIKTFALAGDRTAALAQFESCQEILRDGLGVEVSAETQALYERIRHGDIALPHNLPAASGLTRFVGRETEIADVVQQLTDKRLVSLIGLGGIGKTRLAIEVARQQIGRFRDGVWLVNLAGIERAANIVPAIATALRLNLSGSAALQTQLVDYLRHKHLLLVLDNFEHLLPHTDVVAVILRESAETHLLVTSRERLNLRNEQTLIISGLPVPSDSGKLAAAGAQLFINHAQRVDSFFAVTAENSADIVRLCQLLEGMPLGLELAATWVRLLNVAEIIIEIKNNLAFLQATQRDVPERQRSLESVFTYSWLLLAAEERQTLSQLAPVRGGFDRSAFATITGQPLFQLLNLIDRSLIQRAPDNRFHIHSRLQQFVATQQSDSQKQQHEKQWATYFAAFLAKRQHNLNRSQSDTEKNEILRDLENCVAAWYWAIEHEDGALMVQMHKTLYLIYVIRGQYRTIAQLFQPAIELLREKDEIRRQQQTMFATLHSMLGISYYGMGDNKTALPLLKKAIEAHRKHSPSNEISSGLIDLADCERELGQYVQSIVTLQEAILIARKDNNKMQLARALNATGVAHMQLNQRLEARQAYEEALCYVRELEHKRGEAYMLNNLGVVSIDLGNLETALDYLDNAIPQLKHVEAMHMTAMALTNRSKLYSFQKNFDLAQRDIDEAQRIADSTDNKWVVAYIHQTRGILAHSQKDHARAKHHYQLGQQLFSQIGDTGSIILVLTYLANSAYEQEKWDEALELLQTGFALAVDEPVLAVDMIGVLGLVLIQMGVQRRRACEFVRHSLQHRCADFWNQRWVEANWQMLPDEAKVTCSESSDPSDEQILQEIVALWDSER